MYAFGSYLGPNPASSGESNSSGGSVRPREVAFKRLDHDRAAAMVSSEHTGPTVIEASPLSDDRYSPVDALRHLGDRRPRHRAYDGSFHTQSSERETIKTANRKRAPRRRRGDSRRGPAPDRSALELYGDEGSPPAPNEGGVAPGHDEPRQQGSPGAPPGRWEALTWRMDPSRSLSDFTLNVIGIDDRAAIQKYLNAKKKRKKQKQRRRRDKWMVERLYLDMSQSDDESGNGCRDDNEDQDDHGPDKQRHGGKDDHGLDQPIRHDVRVNSTLSGTKTSNYPLVERYHVHKVNLAVGLRSCDYFTRLFKKKDASYSRHSIELPLSCLPAIPAMLDFLYHPDPMMPVDATVETAVPLRYLGTLLGNRCLFESSTDFLRANLRPRTAVECLQPAELYHQKKLAGVCVRICAEVFEQLKITWFASLAPHLMKRILYSRHFTRSIDGLAVCSKIASYCRCQLHKINREMLFSLTSVEVMPVVCPSEALYFIKMMVRLGVDMETKNGYHCNSSKAMSLYERCVDAAPAVVQGVIGSLCQEGSVDSAQSADRRRGGNRRTKNACGDYSRLPPQIKVDLLEYALARQQKKGIAGDDGPAELSNLCQGRIVYL